MHTAIEGIHMCTGRSVGMVFWLCTPLLLPTLLSSACPMPPAMEPAPVHGDLATGIYLRSLFAAPAYQSGADLIADAVQGGLAAPFADIFFLTRVNDSRARRTLAELRQEWGRQRPGNWVTPAVNAMFAIYRAWRSWARPGSDELQNSHLEFVATHRQREGLAGSGLTRRRKVCFHCAHQVAVGSGWGYCPRTDENI